MNNKIDECLHNLENLATTLDRFNNKGSIMKTVDQLQVAVDEIKQVCDKHGIVLLGTCVSEGIYGEIAILDNTQIQQ